MRLENNQKILIALVAGYYVYSKNGKNVTSFKSDVNLKFSSSKLH